MTDASPDQTPADARSACPLCGTTFGCAMAGGAAADRTAVAGAAAGVPPCWCFAVPPVGAVPGAPAGRCVCPACLRAAADAAARR